MSFNQNTDFVVQDKVMLVLLKNCRNKDFVLETIAFTYWHQKINTFASHKYFKHEYIFENVF